MAIKRPLRSACYLMAVTAILACTQASLAQVDIWDSQANQPIRQNCVDANTNGIYEDTECTGLVNLGLSSGFIGAGLNQRWFASPFRVDGPDTMVVTEIGASWFEPAGNAGLDVWCKIWTGTDANTNGSFIDEPPNTTATLVFDGSIGPYVSTTCTSPDEDYCDKADPRPNGQPLWWHTYSHLCIELAPGNYWITLYPVGLGPTNTTGFNNLAWFIGSPGGDESLEQPIGPVPQDRGSGRRSITWPSPGFVLYTLPTSFQPQLPPSTQEGQDLYNVSFRLRGFALSPEDCNNNGTPDVCEPDCNENGTADECDIAGATSDDCNTNGVPDDCEPLFGTDCNNNGIDDVCEGGVDCNANGTADFCDIGSGASTDCDGDNVPDECNPGCNTNGFPDSCDVTGGTSSDCDGNGVPDECQFDDCNNNGIPDACDIASAASNDCQPNGIPDECDLIDNAMRYTPIDDGLINNAWGFGDGADVACGNTFQVPNTPGGSMLVAVEAAIGSNVTDHHPFTMVVYTDPNNDGNPNDGVRVAIVSSVQGTRDAETGNFITLPIDPPVAVGAPGSWFFVMFLISVGDNDPDWFPCALDSTAPNEVGRSWTGAATIGNFNTLVLAANPLHLIEQDPDDPFSGNFMVRAAFANFANDQDGDGEPDECAVQPCTTCRGDTNGDGIIDGEDIEDFVNMVIGGAPPSTCADVNHDGSVDQNDVPLFVGFVLYGAPCNEIVNNIECAVCAPVDLYCIYTVNNVQGGGCGSLPQNGGTICILCEPQPGFPPGGVCPDYAGRKWQHFDNNGNLVCTGDIAGFAPGGGAACAVCPPNGFQVLGD